MDDVFDYLLDLVREENDFSGIEFELAIGHAKIYIIRRPFKDTVVVGGGNVLSVEFEDKSSPSKSALLYLDVSWKKSNTQTASNL